MNTLRMVCDKLILISGYCAQSDMVRASLGMADVNEPLLKLIGDIFEYRKYQPKLYLDEASLVGSLQLSLDALQGSDIQGLESALNEGLIPELERILAQGGEGLGVFIEARSNTEYTVPELSNVGQAVCMFGYGDGSLYEELSAKAAEGSTFIVFEPERDSFAELKEQLKDNIDYYLLENQLVFAHPGYDRIFASEYKQFLQAVNDNRERVLVNRNTLKRFREDAPKNVLTNLSMVRGANLVTDIEKILPKNVPVILVAAGPSLDRNIEQLRSAKGHALIFAVDTALKYLLKKDIVPDLAISVEPIKPMNNYEDDRCFDIPHVFDCESNPQIVERERNRSFIYNCRDYVKRILERLAVEIPKETDSGGSVATAAFAVCCALRMDTVIMIGQDLSYSGTATHAGAVESAGINGDIGTAVVDGIDGEPVRTRSDWLGYLHWFENKIKDEREANPKMQIIDATEGGALIHGSHVMSLKSAIDKYCAGTDYSFAEELKKLPIMLDEEAAAEFDRLVTESFEQIADLRTTAAHACRICEEAVRKGAVDKAQISELNMSRARCENALIYPLINNYAVTDIADEVSRLRADSRDALGEIKQWKLAFEATVKACDYFQQITEDTWKY